MNWNRINLESSYELDQNFLIGLSMNDLFLLVDCNLEEINEDTIKAALLEHIEAAAISAIEVFEANKENIVNKAVIDRDPEAAAAAVHNDKQTPFLDVDNSQRWSEAIEAIEKGHLIETSEKSHNYFLEVLPPVYMFGSGFVSGEVYSHDSEGKAVYTCFGRMASGEFVAKHGTVQEFRSGQLFKGEIFKNLVPCEI